MRWGGNLERVINYQFGILHEIKNLGKIQFPDGAWYAGEFKNNEIDGFGEYFWPDGRQYKGQWKDNLMDGQGESIWPNGRKYKGEYAKDKQEGFGIYHWGDGRIYYGYWINSLQHGRGILKNNEEGGKEVRGIWQEGIMKKEINDGFDEILKLKQLEEGVK